MLSELQCLYCKVQSSKHRGAGSCEIFAGLYDSKKNTWQEIVISFSKQHLQQGSFLLDRWFEDNSSDFKYMYFVDRITRKTYNYYEKRPPQMEILKFDEKKKIISRRFSAVFIREKSDSLIIKDGRFDIKFEE